MILPHSGTRHRTLRPSRHLIDEIPQIKVPNYAFKNTGSLKFNNVTAEWGMNEPSFSPVQFMLILTMMAILIM